MEKLKLIIAREYLSKVRKKSFIIATLLTPLAIGVFFVVVGYVMTYQGEEKRNVAVIDSSNILGDTLNLKEGKGLSFEKVNGTADEYKESEKYDAVLELPPITDLSKKEYDVNYYSSEGVMGIGIIEKIESDIEKNIYTYKAGKFGFNQDSLSSLKTSVTLERKKAKEDDEAVSTTATLIATGIGGTMGFIMYFAVFLYGMMVMRSVMEEKTSRIVEVMVSSVKPFDLMMGKIIGVGLVGLTQVAIWGILIPIILVIVTLVFNIDPQAMQDSNTQMSGVEMSEMEKDISLVLNELMNQNWLLIIPLFIIYFLGGYLMYASLFAAVGSAMGDDAGESQSLTLPITLPVVMAFYIMFAVVQNPSSSLATWSSMVPFFSPIVMPARLAFDPPWWEILLSVVILIASVIFFVWLSGRIYRVGVLMYGKKVTFKELGKWIFYKN
jgi:ABC-2 type transport system permease protein